MLHRNWIRAVLVLIVCFVGGSVNTALASIETLTGSFFDVTYNTDDLVRFGTPTLTGGVISFLPPNGLDLSVTAGGVAGPVDFVFESGTLLLTPKPNVRIDGIFLSKVGSLFKTGGGITIISGGLTVNNIGDLLNMSSAVLSVTEGQPLAENWQGIAAVSGAGPGNWIPATATDVMVTFNNLLVAVAPVPNSAAAIGESGVDIGVMTTIVPLPPSVMLLAPSLVALVAVRRKRQP